MKQTVRPTRWEAIFHLHLWGTIVTFAIVAVLDFSSLLVMTLALHLTSFGEEQIQGCMPLVVIGGWILGTIMGFWLHKQHLRRSYYDFTMKKINLACITAQSYSAFLYFVTIAVF